MTDNIIVQLETCAQMLLVSDDEDDDNVEWCHGVGAK